MIFAVSAVTLVACYWLWMRYQATDEWKWLAALAFAFCLGVVVSGQLRGPASYASSDDDCISFRFRGNEC